MSSRSWRFRSSKGRGVAGKAGKFFVLPSRRRIQRRAYFRGALSGQQTTAEWVTTQPRRGRTNSLWHY
jgi:hypothetical protein